MFVDATMPCLMRPHWWLLLSLLSCPDEYTYAGMHRTQTMEAAVVADQQAAGGDASARRMISATCCWCWQQCHVCSQCCTCSSGCQARQQVEAWRGKLLVPLQVLLRWLVQRHKKLLLVLLRLQRCPGMEGKNSTLLTSRRTLALISFHFWKFNSRSTVGLALQMFPMPYTCRRR